MKISNLQSNFIFDIRNFFHYHPENLQANHMHTLPPCGGPLKFLVFPIYRGHFHCSAPSTQDQRNKVKTKPRLSIVKWVVIRQIPGSSRVASFPAVSQTLLLLLLLSLPFVCKSSTNSSSYISWLPSFPRSWRRLLLLLRFLWPYRSLMTFYANDVCCQKIFN